jgi:Intracellular proteinase inhibitor
MDGFGWLGGLLLIVALCVGCQQSPPHLEAGVEVQLEASELILLLRANKAVYATGELLELTLELVNRSPRSVTLEFRTAQRYDLLIRNAQGQEVWRWGADQVFAQMLGQETLPPEGGKLTYYVAASAPLPPGSYTITGVVPAVDAQMSARLELTIE